MKRILFIANTWFALYNYRKELLLKLVNEGNDVYALITDDENNKKIEDLGVHVIPVEMECRGTNPIKELMVIFHYKKILKRIRPDIILTYTIKACIYGGIVASKIKIPFVATITGLGTAFQKGHLFKWLIINMYKRAFKKAKYVFFQNDANMQLFLENNIINNAQAIRVNGSGVDLNRFEYFGYPKNDKFYVLYIGRIMKEKGLDELLYAIDKISNPNIQFELIGELKEDKYLEKIKHLEEKHLMRYYGQVENVQDYIQKCNVVVVPSYHEGLNNAILEASACGRPVIATDIPGCREAIDIGLTGFLCEKQSKESLLNVIIKCLNTPIEDLAQMGKNARMKVEKEFNREDIINKYVDVISKI